MKSNSGSHQHVLVFQRYPNEESGCHSIQTWKKVIIFYYATRIWTNEMATRRYSWDTTYSSDTRKCCLCCLITNIVTRNGKIVWKHRLKWPFYAAMLRTKLYYNPFFFPGHENINKQNSSAVRTVYGLIFLPFYKIIVSFFFFFLSRFKQNKIKLCYNGLKFVKETQINTV